MLFRFGKTINTDKEKQFLGSKGAIIDVKGRRVTLVITIANIKSYLVLV